VKRFRFPLETALRLQKRRQKWVENRLRIAFEAVKRAEDEIANRKAEMTRLAQQFEASALQGTLPANWDAYPRNAQRIEAEQKSAEGRKAKAEEAFREIDAERKRIAQYCEALLQLRQQAWDAHRAANERSAQLATDEYVLRNWMEPTAEETAVEEYR
jgi:flagellar biosynthesis chaperone FliJ